MGQDHEQIEKYFFKIDLDDDKSLTTQELAPFIKSSCQDITDDQLQTLIDSFDVNSMPTFFFCKYIMNICFPTRDNMISQLNTLCSSHLW